MQTNVSKKQFSFFRQAVFLCMIVLAMTACQPDTSLTGPDADGGSFQSSSTSRMDGGMGNRYTELYIPQSSGGTLVFNNGELFIPANSIDGSKLIWAEAYSLNRGDFFKRIFEFGPSGTTFSPAATLTLYYCEMGDLMPNSIRLMLYNEASGEWEIASHMINDPQAKSFSGPIEHFSRYSLSGNGQVLEPKLGNN